MTKEDDLRKAINDTLGEQWLRRTALDMAIKANKKMAHGPIGQKALLDLATAFYNFLKGDSYEPR